MQQRITSSVSCRFCELISSKQMQAAVDVPWLADQEYMALVSIGSLVPGWSLVCPTNHGLNLSERYRDARFWAFSTQVVNVVRGTYGDVRVFEHGTVAHDSATSCGTAHAHLHVVPLQFSLAIESMRFDLERHWQPCFASEIGDVTAGREYLFVADQFSRERTAGLLSILGQQTSQFFRRVIAARLGMSQWFDYRRYPMQEIADASVSRLRAGTLHLSSNVLGHEY